MKIRRSAKLMKPMFAISLFIACAVGSSLGGHAQNRRSVIERMRAVERQRNERVREQSARWRTEHERRLLEWRRWAERRTQIGSTRVTTAAPQ